MNRVRGGHRAGACAAMLLVVGLLCGCSLLAPSVPPVDQAATSASPASVPSENPGKAAGSTVPTVAASRQRLRSTLGIQVFWNSTGTQAEMEADANRVFDYIVGLGANSVGINFWFYTNGPDPTHVYGRQGKTPTPATIAMVITAARHHGLRVLVRPLLNEDNLIDAQGDWRGTIRPVSVHSWFVSYYGFLKPYLVAAQRSGAAALDIGSELDSLAPDQAEWTLFKRGVRQVFHGNLEYAVNYGRWQLDPPYEPVPDASVDAYPILGVPDRATVTELTNGWVQWLHHQPSSVLRSTVIQEVGIAAAAGAYARPFAPAAQGTPLDVPIQDNWFAAACSAAKRTNLAGLYFYAVNSTDRPSTASGYAPGSFIGRGDRVIKACFASGWR
jgi:hypothetical protein